MKRLVFNFILAMEAVRQNTLRSILTALGIVFGVGAVIAMLAIGTGAKQQILEKMKLIGTNNIVVTAKVPDPDASNAAGPDGKKQKRPYTPGLTLADANAVAAIVPTVTAVSPEIVLPLPIVQSGKMLQAKCVGVSNDFFKLNNLGLGEGHVFSPVHMAQGQAVCIIGRNVQKRFFSDRPALGQHIKCGNVWLRIVGVLEKRSVSSESLSALGLRDYNDDVYVPVNTALLRFKDRSVLSARDLRSSEWDEEENPEPKNSNYHQLDKITVQVDDSETLRATAQVLGRLLKRRHYGQEDYEIEVPELLLEQQQETQNTFNVVLAAIAGISLLVGGIGIMNIMLASVLERIKEIGVRRSLGAKESDIVWQFLFEAVFISLLGGLLGVGVGVGAASSISAYADIPTVVSLWSVLLSFGIAAAIGLIFGIFPARKAAKQDPIKALRTE